MAEFLFKELTRRIIGVYFDVYNGLGRTYPEFVYEAAMRRDLQRQGIRCERQEEYQVFYKEWLVGRQRLDLFVAGEVIVEIKARPALTRLHQAQTISYLKAFDKRVGLLFNFSSPQPEFERLFFQGQAPESSTNLISQTAAELPANLIAPELVYNIVGGLYTVHHILGPGFIYRIYVNACYRELQHRGLPVRRQKEMQIIYHGEPITAIKFTHLRVGSSVLVFPVAISDINDLRFNNLKDWLRAEQVPLGIIANFHDLALKPIILKA